MRVMRLVMTAGLAASLAASLPACANATSTPIGPTPTRAAAPGLVVALGDSLTSGHGIGQQHAFPAVLQGYVDAARLPLQMVNKGVSGNTSADALQRLPEALAGDVRILIVALGANDGLRGVPVPVVKANLAAIIGEAQGRGIQVLLCGLEAFPIYGLTYTIDFHRMYRQLAQEFDVPLVPFILADVIGQPDLLLPDRVHPNAAGARVIADAIWPYLQTVATTLVAD
jgi:acyl-CoA thioesterase I